MLGDSKTYSEKVADWRDTNKKESFISSFNSQNKKDKVKGGRADRLWVHLNDLFDNKAVRFTDEGISYYLPITHHLTFLPDPAAGWAVHGWVFRLPGSLPDCNENNISR